MYVLNVMPCMTEQLQQLRWWLMHAAETAKAAVQKGQGLRPLLHQIYETRARSYQDAVQQFVEGYKEGYIGTDKDKESPKTTMTDESSDSSKVSNTATK